MCFDGCIQVLPDTFAVKNVPAFCLNGILRDIVAQSTHGGFAIFFPEHPSIVLAADYEIGMASHLAHACDETEDIGVVYSCPSVNSRLSISSTGLTVKKGARANVRAELPLCVRKQAQV